MREEGLPVTDIENAERERVREHWRQELARERAAHRRAILIGLAIFVAWLVYIDYRFGEREAVNWIIAAALLGGWWLGARWGAALPVDSVSRTSCCFETIPVPSFPPRHRTQSRLESVPTRFAPDERLANDDL
jgi:hypothetical protein